MSRFKISVLALSCVVFFSAFSCGCKSKKTRKTTDETRRATALVDDFCAYFKSGKYDKIDKLIGGTSKEFKKLKECNDSGGKDVLEAARKRISYEVGDVTVSDDEGEAVIRFSYFDAKKVGKSIKNDSSLRDIKGMIETAKDAELEFTCSLSYDDDWLIDADSVDEICSGMFPFLDDIFFEPGQQDPGQDPYATRIPVTTTPANQTMTVISTEWFDGHYSLVPAYHESVEFIRFWVVFSGLFDEEQEVTFEFVDAAGNTYEDTAIIEEGTCYVACDWEPKAKLPTGKLTCTVYDSKHNIIATGTVDIVPDSQHIAMPVYGLHCDMVNKDGIVVPGYRKGVSYIAADIDIDHLEPDYEITYEYSKLDDRKMGTLLFSKSVKMDSTNAILPWEGLSDPEPGNYVFMVFDPDNHTLFTLEFKILDDGEEFEMDSNEASLFRSAWCEEAESYDVIDKISKKASHVYFHFETVDFYKYMEFDYEVLDGSGKKYKEGTVFMANTYIAEIEIPLDEDYKGALSIKVYNPSGSLLCESSIEQES